MIASLIGTVRADIDRQLGWAKQEVRRQTRHGALIGALVGTAALATQGAVVVGLIALYTWLATKHGPFVAYGVIGGGLLLTALVLFAFAFLSRRPRLASRPPLQIARPVTLLATPGGGSYAKAAAGGEWALRLAADTLRDGSRSTLLGMLALAAVAGLIAGRKL
jgi:hypothetical protein